MISRTERTAAAAALDELTRFVIRQTNQLQPLSFTAASTLSALDRLGRRRLTELAEQQGVTQPSMTAMVTRLTRDGLVRRERDPIDGRIVLVAITDRGRDLLRRRQQSRLAFLSSLIGELDAADEAKLAAAAPALRALIDLDAVPAALAAAKQAITESEAEDGTR